MKRLFLTLLLGIFLPVGAFAQVVVTSAADDGSAGTLRVAIANAVNGETITFATNLAGSTIPLNSTLTINTNLTIDASALPGGIQINGQPSHAYYPTLKVVSNIVVTLNSLTFTNGGLSVIMNLGTSTLYQCTLSRSGNADGGGILNENGTMTLNQCMLSGNQAGGSGGGIFNQYGTMTLNQCTISGNTGAYGGGIYNAGAMTLNECTISGNTTGQRGDGGGIYNISDNFNATMTLNECTISENTAGDSEGGGGGIYNIYATMTLNECTLSGNAATNFGGGGAIYNGGNYDGTIGTMTLNACTLSGNDGDGGGGGIYNNGGIITNFNSIVAGNTGGIGADIYTAGSATFTGSNIVQSIDEYSGTISGTIPITNAPLLAGLGNYGGPTQTMPPLPGSPAIDAGSDSATNLFTNDQRGYPRLSGLHVDIGAVEVQQPPDFITSPIENANGSLTLNPLTTTTLSSRLYSATNLTPPVLWLPIYTNLNGGLWQFTDTNTAGINSKFYRLSTP